MIYELIIFSAGLLLIISEIVFRQLIKMESRLIREADENRVLIFFILGNIGLWLFFLSAGFMVFESLRFSPKWFILIGFLPGILSAVRSFIFWALSDEKYEKKPAMVEPAGGMGIGCLTLIVLPLLGAIIGLTVYLVLR